MTEYMTEREAAELLRVSPRTMTNWRWAGVGPEYTKAGRRVLYRRADVQRYLGSRVRDNGTRAV